MGLPERPLLAHRKILLQAKLSRYRGMADIERVALIKLDFMSMRPSPKGSEPCWEPKQQAWSFKMTPFNLAEAAE